MSSLQYSDSNQHPVNMGWQHFEISYLTISRIFNKEIIIFSYSRRLFVGTALVCLHNLRKTFKYGGRKMAPSIEEITAISAGRNSKRQIYRLPGQLTFLLILDCFLTNK
jgi:hypothetical protein